MAKKGTEFNSEPAIEGIIMVSENSESACVSAGRESGGRLSLHQHGRKNNRKSRWNIGLGNLINRTLETRKPLEKEPCNTF
jgi:hypothetical protein